MSGRSLSSGSPRVKTLPNGVQVVTQQVPSVRSCGVGLWLKLGSRLEHPGQEGLSHFAEHMLFKGTTRHDARQIGQLINYLGGNVNAFTSQELLCLHARTVEHKVEQALDFLAELLLESTFPDQEIRRERQVILEEWRMYEDSPDELCVDRFVSNLWPGLAMGRPVIGTCSSIRRFSRQRLEEYWLQEFTPDRIVVSLAGAFDSRRVGRLIEQRFGALGARARGARRLPKDTATPVVQSFVRRSTEQAHFCLGVNGPDRLSPDRFAFGLMNMILGGGMNSRLFEEIREKRGLAYSIGSFGQLYSDCGFFAVSGGTSPTTLDKVLTITMQEIARITQDLVTEQELDLAREQVVDAMLMGMENTETRMTRQAEALIAYGRVPTVNETLRHIRQVDREQVRQSAQRYLGGGDYAMCVVGPRRRRVHVQLP